ncbi:MAG TPA: TetR/AcrR family transcriptional regulator [Candidatus Binatia bacterium]|nr:TetR/AcrR family transcriptional regulator [Candidatus Binatia bacterium]
MPRTPKDEAREARNGVYRQHILEAAELVFAERGFDVAKVQEISVKAGLSMGTIYGIFPGKTELYTALLDERGQELLKLASETAARDGSPREQLLALIDVYVGYFVDHPDFLRMHLRSGVSWALGSAVGTATSVQYWQNIHELQADIFRRGVAAGEFVDEAPDFLARTFSVMDQVLLSDWVARGMVDDRATLVRRLSHMVSRAFCVG